MTNIFQLVDEKQEQFAQLQLSSAQAENLAHTLDIELTYNSNAIEGSTLSYRETKLILEEGITIPGKKLREHLEATNHQSALEFIQTLKSKKSQELTAAEILHIHELILRGIDDENAGRYRQARVGIAHSPVILPNPLKVPELMTDFWAWLSTPSSDHPLKRACDAHYKLVSIHPFIDGNGRTARLLMNLILLQAGFPLFAVRVERRKEYLDTLEQAQINAAEDIVNPSDQDLAPFYNLIGEELIAGMAFYLEAERENIFYK